DWNGWLLTAIGGSSGRCTRANTGASWLLQSMKIDFMAAPFPRRLRAYSTVSTASMEDGTWLASLRARSSSFRGEAAESAAAWGSHSPGGGGRPGARAQTVLASSSEQNLAAAAKAVAAEGPQPLTVAGDLRKLEACEQLFRRVNERFQRCDVLVNNAGATRAGAFLELPDAVWLDGFALK